MERINENTLPVLEILEDMAKTFRERSQQYKSNWQMVGGMMKVLFPDGVPPKLVTTQQFHLFELVLVKLSRYAVSNLQHRDSIHDAAVYAIMCEGVNQLCEKELQELAKETL